MILQFEMFSILMYFKMYVIGKTVFFLQPLLNSSVILKKHFLLLSILNENGSPA